MAETDPKPQKQMEENEVQRLKYLEFVQVAALHAVLCAAKLYAYAKDNSGPLKPGVESVEGTVKTVVGPVYDKFHDVPVELLKFVDRKVDESVNKMENYVPPYLKQVKTQAFSAAQKAPATARTVVSEVKSTGVVETASGLAKNVYIKYEPAAKELYTPNMSQWLSTMQYLLGALSISFRCSLKWHKLLSLQLVIVPRNTTRLFSIQQRRVTRLLLICLWCPLRELLGYLLVKRLNQWLVAEILPLQHISGSRLCLYYMLCGGMFLRLLD